MYLSGLGDDISWLGRNIEPPGFAHSLMGHLRDKFANVRVTVTDRPLFLMNPKTGQREYLKWISKDKPFKYLGVQLTAGLCWDFEYQYLLDKLNPLIRQVKAARKIGLAWDVFVAAVNSKIVGLTNYHMGVVPFSRAQSTVLNNKVTMALKNTAAASPQQLRCQPPIGISAPDLSLSAAQIKVQLALNILHSNDQEGQALRWCLRSVQLHSNSRAFPWEDVFLWQSAKKPGFVDAVAQSLQQIGLCIRTDSALFEVEESSQCPSLSFERGIDVAAPVADREAIAQYMNNKRLVSDRSFEGLRRHAAELEKRGLGQHVLTVPRPGLTPLSRTPLWESLIVDTTETQLAEYTTISDGTGNGVIGTCQLADDACKALVSKLHAGDTAVDAELLGLIQSFMSLVARRAPADQARMLCDCQAAMALFARTRQLDYNPMLKVQGRGAILQLFLATHFPLSPLTDYAAWWVRGHSDKVEPHLINEADKPDFAAHVICDQRAPECSSIASRTGITFYETDFQFVVGNEKGERVLTPLKTYVRQLGHSTAYHARMTATSRVHVTGESWRSIELAGLYLPKSHTAWNSDKTFNPGLRDSMDCVELRERLAVFPQLKKGVVGGREKTLSYNRVQVIGGLTTLTILPGKAGQAASGGACPFCIAAPLDTLEHALHDCLSDRWTAHLTDNWGQVVTELARDRYRVATITAILELGCPIDLTRVSRRNAPPTKERADPRMLRTVGYVEVCQTLKERAAKDISEVGARRWFASEASSLGGKRAAWRAVQRNGESGMPAAQLMQAVIDKQQRLLTQEQEKWRERTGATTLESEEGKALARCLAMEARSSKLPAEPDTEAINMLTQFEQALVELSPGWCEHGNEVRSLSPEVWCGIISIQVGRERGKSYWIPPRPRLGYTPDMLALSRASAPYRHTARSLSSGFWCSWTKRYQGQPRTRATSHGLFPLRCGSPR
jgi:hypothetical protein